MLETKAIDADQLDELLQMRESHFVDLKSSLTTPAKLSKSISAFANASGGELYVGIDETLGANGRERTWSGFAAEEEANPIFQVLQDLNPLGNNYTAEFLTAPGVPGLVLHLTIFKTQTVIFNTDGRVFVRRNAQNLPVIHEDEWLIIGENKYPLDIMSDAKFRTIYQV